MQTPKEVIKKETGVRMIGLEFENTLVHQKSGHAIGRTDIKTIWELLTKNSEWQKTFDQYTHQLIGATKKTKSGEIVANTDAGAFNLELAMPPCENLKQAEEEWRKAFAEILAVTKRKNITALSLGVVPRTIKGNLFEIKTEKGLYSLINKRFKVHNIAIPISAHQTCIDVSVSDMTRVINMLIKISGFIVAVSANSILENDKLQHWKEVRLLHWKIPPRDGFFHGSENIFGVPKRPFKDLSDYFRYIWQASPMLIVKNGEWSHLKNKRISGWDYLTSGKKYEGETILDEPIKLQAEKEDLDLMMMLGWLDAKAHILTISNKITLSDFTNAVKNEKLEKYLKNRVGASYVEVRSYPASPKGEEMAIPALLLGLVNNLEEFERFAGKFTWRECVKLRDITAIKGMDCSFKGKKINIYVDELIKIAEKGSIARKFGEETFLKPLYKRISTGRTPADVTKETYLKKGMAGVISQNSY